MIKRTYLSLFFIFVLATSGASWADELKTIKFCALSLMGDNGPEVQIIKDYEIAARGWGAKLVTKLYPNEKIIVNELKTGACDMATLTSAEVSQFNSFTGTIGAMGAIPDYQHLKLLLATLNSEKAQSHLVQNGYEVVGIQPAGAVSLARAAPFRTENRAGMQGQWFSRRRAMSDSRAMGAQTQSFPNRHTSSSAHSS